MAQASLAIVLEPTDLQMQLACMGALRAEVINEGQAAHAAVARRQCGDQGGAVACVLARDRQPVEVRLTYREVTNPTQAGPTTRAT